MILSCIGRASLQIDINPVPSIPNPELLLMKVYAWNSQSQPFTDESVCMKFPIPTVYCGSVCMKFPIPTFHWWKCMYKIPNPFLLLMKVYAWNSQSQPFIDGSVSMIFPILTFYWWKCIHEIPNLNLLLMEVYPWNYVNMTPLIM